MDIGIQKILAKRKSFTPFPALSQMCATRCNFLEALIGPAYASSKLCEFIDPWFGSTPTPLPAPPFAVKYLCFHILWKIESNLHEKILLQFCDVILSLSLFAKVKIKLIQNIFKLDGDFVLKLKLQYLQQITSCKEEILAFEKVGNTQ